jgi:transcription termination/antitermination protein NusA
LEIKEGLKGEEVIVSRAHNGLLEGLFKREVPEVAQGAVEIKDIIREPGNRSKIAVASNQSGIDPVGSCVGQKGVRVQAIIQEFNGIEKIDIIQWQENSKNYVAQALSPAKELQVVIDEKEKVARVSVAPEELSLAIGKDGQNVRLASKLTGFRIEIEGDEKLSKLPPEEKVEAKKEVKEEAEAKEKVKQSEVPEQIAEPVEDKAEPVAIEEVPVLETEKTAAEEVAVSPSEDVQQTSSKKEPQETPVVQEESKVEESDKTS